MRTMCEDAERFRERASEAEISRLLETCGQRLARFQPVSARGAAAAEPLRASLAVMRAQLGDATLAAGRRFEAGRIYRQLEDDLLWLPANAPSRALLEVAPCPSFSRAPGRSPGRVQVPVSVRRLLLMGSWSELYREAARQLDEASAPRIVRGSLHDVLAFSSLRLCQPRRVTQWLFRRIRLGLPDGAPRYAWRYWLWSRSLVARGRWGEARDLLMNTVVLFDQGGSPECSLLMLQYLLGLDDARGIHDLRDALGPELTTRLPLLAQDFADWRRRFEEVGATN
jgi:hypothetical protein